MDKQALSAIAARFGARLGPENHTGCSRDPESLQQLFDAMADVPNFGLLLHVDGWHSGDPSVNNLQFAKYAMHIARLLPDAPEKARFIAYQPDVSMYRWDVSNWGSYRG